MYSFTGVAHRRENESGELYTMWMNFTGTILSKKKKSQTRKRTYSESIYKINIQKQAKLNGNVRSQDSGYFEVA